MRKRIVRIILFSLVCLNLITPQQQSHAEVCPTYNFQSIFYDDYWPGDKWDNRSGITYITWSANESVIHDESVNRSFTPEELEWVRSAFQSWDDALDTVEFSEIAQTAQAEIVIGYVVRVPDGNTAYWNAWKTSELRDRATIKLRVSDTTWFSNKNRFIHVVQHELGNVLGLGDIRPTSEFTSTQEDEFRPPYGLIPLSDFDTGMIRQLYGESTCPSTFPKTVAKVAAELKAKQDAEVKAAGELKAKQAAEAKAAASRKTTIVCVKGKLTKKVTAVKPKCPSGYKLKK